MIKLMKYKMLFHRIKRVFQRKVLGWDNFKLISREVKKHRHEIVLPYHGGCQPARLEGFIDDKEDYYYVFTCLNKGIFLSSCVGSFVVLKNKIKGYDYKSIEKVFDLNIEYRKKLRPEDFQMPKEELL